PKIPTTPLSAADVWPILEHLGGPDSPREWQGALPFTYHLGPGPAKVKLHLKQDYQFRTIWDVIGRVPGTDFPDQLVVSGNHRDAWVFGAVDPNSGTAGMLEAVHGIGALLKSGWKPKRTLIFASWDGEEEGLVGSTEWGEQHEKDLANAVAYFNMDVAVSGPNFGASAVPSLKQFLRDVTQMVPSPKGGTVYDQWRNAHREGAFQEAVGPGFRPPAAETGGNAPVGDLGSGSDYTVFLQHLGVPSADIGSTGPYGVYHSAFDNFAWFKKFGDPDFSYIQQMARIFGLNAIRMADTDVLPYDYETYGKEVEAYLDVAKKKAEGEFGPAAPDFNKAMKAAQRLEKAGAKIYSRQNSSPDNAERLNAALLATEHAMLLPAGLPNRPWFRHAIYAPGRYTGYAAVVIPGVNEAITQHDLEATRQQIEALATILENAMKTLDSAR
ncbi:MAG TPA: transferrin receptor-like dimerization domain-containing protein, partial [Terriglobales bacterium]